MGYLLYLMFRCDRRCDRCDGKFGNFMGTKHTPSCEYPKTSGSPCAAGSSGVKLSRSSKVKASLSGRKEEEEGPAPASG